MTEEQRWEHDMERAGVDLDEFRVFGLLRALAINWPRCPLRERLIADWVETDRMTRGLLVTSLGVARGGLSPAEYASALLVAYLKKVA
jgi:hypothetical protein